MQFIYAICIISLIAHSHTQVSKTIQESRNTTPCQRGYYWTGQSCMPCQPVTNGYCMCSRQNGCDSLQCDSGYMQLGNATNSNCVPCPTGCGVCSLDSNRMICTDCLAGYVKLGFICIPAHNCREVYEETVNCASCQPSHYLANEPSINYTITPYYFGFQTQCQPCVANCDECYSAYTILDYQYSTTCLRCNSGYSWFGTSCTACPKNCGACVSEVNTCDVCMPGYVLNANQSCISCGINSCTNCMLQSSQVICLACQSGLVLSNNKCVRNGCTQYCANCDTNTGSCLVCKIRSVLQNSTCLPCPSNCQTCVPVNGTQTTQCVQCLDTYFQNKNTGVCTLCSSYQNTWIRCKGPQDIPQATNLQPTQCIDNYFLVRDSNDYPSCLEYSPNNTCLTLQSDISNTACQTCLVGYTQIQPPICSTCPANCENTVCTMNSLKSVMCNTCQEGYYLANGQTSCLQCPSSCSSCQNQYLCSSCAPGYLLSNQTCYSCNVTSCSECTSQSCVSCMDGYFLSGSLCVSCPISCGTCEYPGNICSSCLDGYLQRGDACISLQSLNCLMDNGKSCTVCNYGYYLLNNTCFECLNPLSGFNCNYTLAETNSTNQSKTSNSSILPTDSTASSNLKVLGLCITILLLFLLL